MDAMLALTGLDDGLVVPVGMRRRGGAQRAQRHGQRGAAQGRRLDNA
ncbi:Uncharacterised protein [Bordetella pertussis]|nr:Uncharacterised protein [Bordetella pertussis]